MIRNAVFCICLLVAAQGASGNDVFPSKNQVDKAAFSEMLCTYIDDSLWSKVNAYDAAHVLMVPLENAFFRNDAAMKRCFSEYFSKLQRNSDNRLEELGALTWLQHLHLVARYAVLANDIDLADWLKTEFNSVWYENEAWLWAQAPFAGISERVKWKLNSEGDSLAKSYYNVIFDEDYFALTLGVDLYGMYSRRGQLEKCPGCQEAKDLFLRVFEERVTWVGNGWLIDVGRWRDHGDFAYSGYVVEPINNEGQLLPPNVASRVTVDSSHAHRFPSWLRSAELAFEGDEKEYVNRLQRGLRAQFSEHILADVSVDGMPLLNNFMDGGNGYFRYNYSTHGGASKGYSPYGLSGTLAYGWWAMLGGEEVSKVYSKLSDSFPLSPAQRRVYSGPSTRERHPVVTARFDNSLLFAISEMASELSSDYFGDH